MVWLPRRLFFSESSFYSSMLERRCIFANGNFVQTILGGMDYLKQLNTPVVAQPEIQVTDNPSPVQLRFFTDYELS